MTIDREDLYKRRVVYTALSNDIIGQGSGLREAQSGSYILRISRETHTLRNYLMLSHMLMRISHICANPWSGTRI